MWHRYAVLSRSASVVISLAAIQILLIPLLAKRAGTVAEQLSIPLVTTNLHSNSGSPITNINDEALNDSWEAPVPAGLPVEINFRYAEGGRLISAYAFYVGHAGKDSTDRMPKRWRFEASHDVQNWITLDQQTVVYPWEEGETREFRVNHPDRYEYYRLVIEGLWNSSIIRINEITFK